MQVRNALEVAVHQWKKASLPQESPQTLIASSSFHQAQSTSSFHQAQSSSSFHQAQSSSSFHQAQSSSSFHQAS
jgi:hypothetical protein